LSLTSIKYQEKVQDSTDSNANKSGLFKLRKTTGFGMAKCREALTKYDGNIEEVEIEFKFKFNYLKL
jgi:hypothetical protein